ncbi:hypothetical protein [Verrucosispora sp. ts21]|uniref:hypothetical protein n=1 Tax=Verrucosispora sp. ts21 TaxID=2069341 RepID=UPI0011AEF1E6|nr:hypothetical protein [Verrucosispora sp. ts21]
MITLSAPSWTDTGGFWIALAALVASIAALGVSIWSAYSGHQSAIAGRESAMHAGTSAKAAEAAADSSNVAARAAEKSADADGKVARLELDRDHEAYRPVMPGPDGFQVVRESLNTVPELEKNHRLVYEFTPARTYRVVGEAVYRSGSPNPMTLSMPLLCRAGVPVRIVFEDLVMEKQRSDFSMLRFKFWPPAEVDLVEHWTCRCERPLESDGAPHWEATIAVGRPQGWPIARVGVQ